MSEKENYVNLSVSDGSTMAAYVSRPPGPGKHPGIMVFQEAFGVNAYIRSIADRLADEGFTAIAPELFHRTAPGFDGDYNDFNSTRQHISAINDAALEADIRATYDWLIKDQLTSHDQIFTIGFCLGGTTSFRSDLILPVKASVAFYGSGIAGLRTRAKELHAPVLMFWGGLDKNILPEHTRSVEDALRAEGKDYGSVTFSYAGHGFFCDQRAAYNERASRQAWPMTVEFLKYHLK